MLLAFSAFMPSMAFRECGCHSFQFRIEPNGAELRLLKKFAGMSRFIFNKALSIQLSEQELTGKKQGGYATLCKLLTEWRNSEDTHWLAEGPSLRQNIYKGKLTAWVALV
jgi:hypothetical protein